MNRKVAVIIIAALAHFTYFFLRYGSFYFPDSFTYLDPAKSLLLGHGFGSDTIRTPGYPLLLALFGARTVPVIVFQHLLSIALAFATYVFFERRVSIAAEGGGAPLIAALLVALDIPTIHYANKILTETLFTAVLFLVFVMLLAARPRVVIIGLLVGALVLIRPIALFFFIVLAPFLPRKRIIPFVIAALLLPAGWAVRNWFRTGVFTVSSIGGINLLSQRAAGALAIEDEGDFRADLAMEQVGLIEDADDEIQRQLHIPDAEELPVAVRAQHYYRFARRVILQHPLAFVELTVRGVLINVFDSDWDALEMVSTLHPSTVQVAISPLPPIEFAFAIFGIIALWRRDRRLAMLIVVTIGYFIVISAGGEAESRFRVPVIPQLAIAVAVGLSTRSITRRG